MTNKLCVCIVISCLVAGCETTEPTGTTSTTASSGGSGPSTGNLRVTADSPAHVYVANAYQGHGAAYLTLSPGSYLVQAKAHSDNHVCWEVRSTVYAGKTSTVYNNSWCR